LRQRGFTRVIRFFWFVRLSAIDPLVGLGGLGRIRARRPIEQLGLALLSGSSLFELDELEPALIGEADRAILRDRELDPG
jgi:hypothetical protein